MNYFLDTDTCIFALKNTFPAIKEKIGRLMPDQIKVPAIVKAELLLGTLKSRDPKRVGSIVESFLGPFEIVSFSGECAEVYAKVRWELEGKGRSIGPNDLLIAATVIAERGTLITHNTKEFDRISHLKIEDWTLRT